ncbi:uncharacterized protein TRUGW13939_09551 [Talaromyces rugulosus]|uniref:Enoyl reductase (ER) domain-containing protein n=1 Tax=Talaromyces rugulosus TaxID=121627 RepID=A0A7H8R7M7_TALRU|nr:uncharacterized protein TRUGW13939_09551 [Talaromyces rugulosus]QKX62392.1 hypothetical protein TRUGW13939_09551 [Talaromyces rugulosus]
MPPPTDLPIHSFPNASALESFLEHSHTQIPGFHLKIAKKASGIPSVSAADAVQVALCFGWIDGQANSFDADWYLTRYTPRRPKSIWSQKNVDTVTRLLQQQQEDEGKPQQQQQHAFRMRPAGISAVEAAKADGRWARAYAGPATMTVPDDFAAALAAVPAAQGFFERQSKTARYTVLMKLYTGAERTRAKRIAGLVQLLAEEKMPGDTKSTVLKKGATIKKVAVKKAAVEKAAVEKRKALLEDGDEDIPTRAKTRRAGLRRRYMHRHPVSSGSDLRNLHAFSKYTPIPGHEAVGTIVQLGHNTPTKWLHRRVGIKWVWQACGSCSLCLRGQTNHCPNQLNTGRSVHGTLQEYALARPAFVSLVPDGLDSKLAAPLMCAGHTLVGAVSKLDAHLAAAATAATTSSSNTTGDKPVVVVLGAGGGLGHLGVQIARHRGYRVVAIDAGAEKEKLCLSLGAEHYIDITTTSDIPTRIKQLIDDSEEEAAHAAIIVSGAEDAFSLAPRLVRNGGVLVVVGLPRNDFLFPVAPIEISSRGLSIVGASAGTETQMDELLAMADEKIVVPRVEVVAFKEEEVATAFQRLEDGDVVGRLVVRVS